MINGMWVFVILCVFTVIFCAIQTYSYRKNKLPTFDEINDKFKKGTLRKAKKRGV